MSQEARDEEAMMEMTQEEVREEGAGTGVSAESGELEAKTQETHHPTRGGDRRGRRGYGRRAYGEG